jgi:hypothetical protein
MVMRNVPFVVSFLCGMVLAIHTGVSQTNPNNSNDGAPFGGAKVSVGSVNVEPAGPGPAAPSGSSSVCVTIGNQDPCVLTGQYNRYRNSTNVQESSLAGFNTPSTFGLAYFYQLTTSPAHTPPNGFEPVVAQPLYVTNVPQTSGTADMLLVASLDDYLYAFDTKTGNQIWFKNLATLTTHCATGGAPFNVQAPPVRGLPGAAGLPYYGIVATPVIDTEPNPPVAYVTSACVTLANTSKPRWFLDAIDLKQGAILATQEIIDASFTPANQLSRASLLLTHPGGAESLTDVYISFGTGAQEIGAANSQGQIWAYSGVLFGYEITYPGVSPWVQFTPLGSSPFNTTCPTGAASCTTNYGTVFPSAYAGFDTNGYPLGPKCATGGGGCSPGENWAVNGGGCWMSSKGPSSDASANVYLACGNGAFACASTGGTQTDCTNVANVYYWGESAFTFPAATSAPSMGTPRDFYAPHDQRYVCPYGASSCAGYNMPNPPTTPTFTTDASPASFQTEELSRLDQDFGLSGQIIIPAGGQAFSMTSDKSGYGYVMPPSGPSTQSLGQFKAGDVGLTNQTYKTQLPFQLSRKPKIADQSYKTVCQTINNTTGVINGNPCDEVHELAWNNNLLFVWPTNETAEVFQGSYNSTTQTYSFGTTPAFDPCSSGCTGFPATTNSSAGAPMALAANNTASPYPLTTLWAVVPHSTYSLGTLYGYTVNGNPANPPLGSLGTGPAWYWEGQTTGTNHCTSTPNGITGFFPLTFTEPTLADNQQKAGNPSLGAVYVPTMCVINDGNQATYLNCGDAVNKGAIPLSGVLVFTTCP